MTGGPISNMHVVCTNVPINYISKAILSYITYDHTKTIHIQMPRVNSILQIKASFLKYNTDHKIPMIKISRFAFLETHGFFFFNASEFYACILHICVSF